MLTFPPDLDAKRDNRAPYRPYRATVRAIRELSPSFCRVTFSSPEFLHFATHGLDQRIKLIFPIGGFASADVGVDDVDSVLEGTWYVKWRELPDARRSPIRTYTVRDVRPILREIDVDFVWHGDGGPAARWLAAASIGDDIVIVGPDARSEGSALGIDWHPGGARELLLAGDATATPAICSILESLPGGTRARAFMTIPNVADAVEVSSRADIRVSWIVADQHNYQSEDDLLHHAVRDWAASSPSRFSSALSRAAQIVPDIDVDREVLWDSPTESGGDFFAWLAGESAMIKRLRRLLVTELGIDRSRVAFMGYWRRGNAEAQ